MTTVRLGVIAAVLSVLSPITVMAQTDLTGTVEGRVLLKGVRDPVAGATVQLEGVERTATTDREGRFRFDAIPTGEYRLTAVDDFIEPCQTVITVIGGETVAVICYANPSPALLGEVLVEEPKDPADPSRREISRTELDGVPGANGDVIRVVQNLPGVALSGPATGYAPEGLVIRGTNPEDSKYFFNGFEIPQLFHFGALISVINAEVIEDIAYSPGGFGVRYGDAIGGYVDVTGRSPRNDRFGGVVDLSTYSAFVLMESPVGERTAAAAALRRSTIDQILPELIPRDQAAFTLSPRFYDYVAIVESLPNSANRIALTALGSYDHTALLREIEENEPFSPDTFDIEIGWHSVMLDWDFAPSRRVRQSLSAQFTYLENAFAFGSDLGVEATVYWPAVLEELSIAVGDWNELRFGAQGAFVVYDSSGVLPLLPKEGNLETSWTNADSTRFSDGSQTWTLDGWADDVMEPAAWVRVVPGLRVSHMQLIEETSLDPRLNAQFFPSERGTINTSVGVYHQWPDRDEMLPNLGNTELEHEVAYQAGAGFEYDFDRSYSVDAQAYYKYLDHLVIRTGPDVEEPYENTGRGVVYGAEFLARKRLTDRLFGWLSYSYGVSRRRDTPEAAWRYFDDDQTHNFIALASYTLGERKLWKVGGRWQIVSGKPFTEIESAVFNSETDSYLPIYSETINGKREQPYHQLDLRVDKLWVFNTWTLDSYIDLQNIYQRRYPVGYRYNFDYSKRKAIVYPTFIPSFGLQARF